MVIYEFPQVALCLKLAPHPAHQHFHWSCKAKWQILQKMRDLLKSRTTSPRTLAKLWDIFAKMTLLRIVRSAVPWSPSLLVTVFIYWASTVLSGITLVSLVLTHYSRPPPLPEPPMTKPHVAHRLLSPAWTPGVWEQLLSNLTTHKIR